MDKRTGRLIEKAKKAKGAEDIRNVIPMLNESMKNSAEDIPLLHARAELYVKLQNLGQAVNDYRLILSYDENDRIASGQIEHLTTIMRFSGNDIYANPNTNLDPWLE
ncbi:MAG: hypothetical protein GXO86_11130 [Chlorobi bacterium]|nr:hypothetical protein [Chlorobiota bacterium]